MSPASAGRFFTTEPPGKPLFWYFEISLLCIYSDFPATTLISVDLKNIHNLKAELWLIQQKFLGLLAWEIASQVTP